jgi:hypothetical protein
MSERCASRRNRWSQHRVVATGLFLAGALAVMRPASADDRLLIEGLLDAEGWNTGGQSVNLSRNEGEPAGQGRLRLWAAVQLTDSLQGMALGRFESGHADTYLEFDDTEATYAQLDEAWVRYTFPTSFRLVAQGGLMTQPIGSFSRRYLSSANPLIGSPANYVIDYPAGLSLSGSAGMADFLIAVTDKPLAHQVYLPEPSSSPRPSIAAGITPIVGFRLGAFATWGPYLAPEAEPWLAAGESWRDFDQRIVGFDLQYSRGHFELNGEMTRSLYEVPGQNDERGIVWYLEPKYTWSPRWFGALRLQRSQETQVWMPWITDWYVTDEDSWDVEAGAGYRIDPHTVIKLAYRVERSDEDPDEGPVFDHAVAFQLSCGFDVRSWFERPQ